MPWENIGDCGDGQVPRDEDWIVCCLEMGIVYLHHICGDPPDGCELNIFWHDHELGNYPTIALLWGEPQTDAPWDYISQCETALGAFNAAIPWSQINPTAMEDLLETNARLRSSTTEDEEDKD